METASGREAGLHQGHGGRVSSHTSSAARPLCCLFDAHRLLHARLLFRTLIATLLLTAAPAPGPANCCPCTCTCPLLPAAPVRAGRWE